MPGGSLGDVSSCAAQYQQSPTLWGPKFEGVASSADCENLPQELRNGCLCRFGWFADSKYPTVNFEQVICPKALTVGTGCTRKDDRLLSSFTSSAAPSVPSKATAPLTPSTSNGLKLKTGSIVGMTIVGATVLISLAVAVYYSGRRRRKDMDKTLLEDKKALSKDSSMEIVARSKPLDVVDRDRGIQELYPGYLQELDTTQIRELNAKYSSELESTQRTQGTSRGKKIPSAKNLKPLPRLPGLGTGFHTLLPENNNQLIAR
ncbi:MAG: hypothetical protein Q9203_003465 [Teloschistes exilis]